MPVEERDRARGELLDEGLDCYFDGLTNVADSLATLVARMRGQRAEVTKALKLLLACEGKVVVTGLGKSGLIGNKIAATLASTGTAATAINAADALHGDLGTISGGDVVVMLSNSAATRELLEMVPSLQRMEVPVIGLFGRGDTVLAERVNCVLDVSVGREGCPLNLAPMASTSVALAVGDGLAAAMMKMRGFRKEDFAVRHPAGSLGRRLLMRVADVMTCEHLPTVEKEADFRTLVSQLTRSNLGAVCVTNERGVLLGIISDGDVRRAILREQPFALSAGDLMTSSPLITRANVLLDEVLKLMENGQRKVYVLPVVDGDDCLIGMIRMHDIISG